MINIHVLTGQSGSFVADWSAKSTTNTECHKYGIDKWGLVG